MLRTLLHRTLLTALLVLLGGWAVVAQRHVVKGTVTSFQVEENSNYTYHWSVYNKTLGQNKVLDSQTHESGEVMFDLKGTYEVRVYPEDKVTRCYGEQLAIEIVVDDSAPTAVFDGDIPGVICAESDQGGERSVLSLNVKYTGPKPWTFKYTVNRAPAEQPQDAEVIWVDEFAFNLTLPNRTGKTKSFEILLVEAKSLDGNLPVMEDPDKQKVEIDVMPLPLAHLGDYEAVVRTGSVQTYTATIGKKSIPRITLPEGASIINQTEVVDEGNNTKEVTFQVQWGTVAGDYQIGFVEENAMHCLGDMEHYNVRLVESFTITLEGDVAFCAGSTETLIATVDLPGNYSYKWNEGSEGQTLEVSKSGTYTVTVTDLDNGDVHSASLKVEVWALPDVDLGADYMLAEGEVKTLDAGNPGSAYVWSTGATTQTIEVSNAGTYGVEVTNEHGCKGTDEIVITSEGDIFAINLGEDVNLCDGSTVTLDPKPTISQHYTYLWSDGSNATTLAVSETGDYSVTVRDDQGNERTDEVHVEVHPLPIVDLGEDIVLYDGETASLDAGDAGTGATYEWNTGDDTQKITVAAEGLYSVMVTSQWGCSNSDEVVVTRREGHKFSVYLGGDQPICEGERIYLEPTIDRTFAQEPTYFWIPSESTEKGIMVDKSGKYCVKVTDPFGNTEEDCMTLTVNPSPKVDLGEDQILESGEAVVLDAGNPGSFYNWSTGAISQSISVKEDGNYWVEVTNTPYGCVGRDTVSIEYNDADVHFVGLPTGFSPNNDGINDVLFVRGKDVASMSLIIMNRLGHRIFQSNRQDVGWDGTYRGVKQDMDVYVYQLRVTLLNGKKISKRGNITLLY